MNRQSPPKHRHDGTSPLPLGMDWSPPPRKWNGRDTVWPHNPCTGWSYCVTIPAWVVLQKSRDSDPVVFYRVQVGVQSPQGETTTRIVLRRFNDFLKLFAALRKSFPKKNIPPAPPKGILRMKNRALLEERRCSLEEWLGKLLSDLDMSRSAAVASFLELEAAARFSFQDENLSNSEENQFVSSKISSWPDHPNSIPNIVAGVTSLTSDYGSDTAYETSEVGTSSIGRDNNSEVGLEDLSLDEDLTSPIEKLVKYGMSNIDEGLFMGQAILEQLEGLPRRKVEARQINSVIEGSTSNGGSTKASFHATSTAELFNGSEHSKVIGHGRKLSDESLGSEISSSGFPNSFGDGLLDIAKGTEVSKTMEILGGIEQISGDGQLMLPLDQRQKMHKVLMTMKRRLGTAKTDMEDLISRLNQEIAVKDYLTTKVKDLEVELETTKKRSKESLQQAILIEKERFTQMQWDMEGLRQRSLEMELKLKSLQDGRTDLEQTDMVAIQRNDILLSELDASKQKFEDLQKRHQELEVQSRSHMKVLGKEVKSLRSSQAKLELQLNQSLKEKSEAERLLLLEKQKNESAKATWRKLLHECESLCNRLQECNISLVKENGDNFVMDSSSLPDAIDLLNSSDNQIIRLLLEAQQIAKEDECANSSVDEGTDFADDDDLRTIYSDWRKVVKDIFIDNATLRKQVNSVIRYALKVVDTSSKKDDDDDDDDDEASLKQE